MGARGSQFAPLCVFLSCLHLLENVVPHPNIFFLHDDLVFVVANSPDCDNFFRGSNWLRNCKFAFSCPAVNTGQPLDAGCFFFPLVECDMCFKLYWCTDSDWQKMNFLPYISSFLYRTFLCVVFTNSREHVKVTWHEKCSFQIQPPDIWRKKVYWKVCPLERTSDIINQLLEFFN